MIKKLILVILTFASIHQARARELVDELDYRLANLYVFKIKDDAGQYFYPERITLMVTFARHEKSHSTAEVFLSKRRKISIFVSTRTDVKPNKTFTFYFGGKEQFAVFLGDSKDALVGTIGEVAKRAQVSVYAGLRDDPAFLDEEAFRGWKKAPCTPVVGLRCEGDAESPKNSFANTSVGVVAIDLPVVQLTGLTDPNIGVLKVWAKSYAAE